MDADELLRQAKEKLDQMQKDIAELKKLNLAALMPPEGQRSRKDPRHDHGAVIIRAKGGIIEAGTTVPEPPKDETEYTRTVSPMRSKHQRTMIEKIWKYRNFKRCGNCGRFDTYVSRSLADTNGVLFWCYSCGRKESVVPEITPPGKIPRPQVTDRYEGTDPETKYRPTYCVLCGNVINFTRGDKAWKTGETDPNTNKPDYRCDSCNELEKLKSKK